MKRNSPVVASLVIYAKDIAEVATFYERTLCLSTLEFEPGFVIVGNSIVEIAVVQMPEAIAKDVHISVPPYVREETPLKLSFLVNDLEHVHAEAVATGGDTKPIENAWRWRGQLHLDGHDPEGNVVQFRKADA